MSTIDRLRELMRNNRAAKTPARTEPSSATPPSADHDGDDFEPPLLSGRAPGGGALRELVYEPVDEAGQPMPSREEAPALPGASLLETPLGRCIHIDYLF